MPPSINANMHKTGILAFFLLLNNKGQNEKKQLMMLKTYVDKQALTDVQIHIYTHSHTHAPTHMRICAHTDILLPLKDGVQV